MSPQETSTPLLSQGSFGAELLVRIGEEKQSPRSLLRGFCYFVPMAIDIQTVLAARGQRYGAFLGHAEITQKLKGVMLRGEGLPTETAAQVRSRVAMMAPDQLECLEMICHKVGRVLNGDPHYEDSWRDVAGYSTLVADRLLEHQPKLAVNALPEN